jgi:hypothetical protein
MSRHCEPAQIFLPHCLAKLPSRAQMNRIRLIFVDGGAHVFVVAETKFAIEL